MKQDKDKLRLWQERLSRNDSLYSAEVALMDTREALYSGSNTINALVKGDSKKKTPHVRNICSEAIEAQVNSSIPKPKVTARRDGDELKAKLIEDMLRNELDRQPFELINDMLERTVPIQGGAVFLVEWDNTKRTHLTVGELAVSALHPKQVIPQDGVFTGIEDMDYIILKIPQTKGYIKRRYDVDVSGEHEAEPEIKSSESVAGSDELVTQYIAYYRNDSGGIGLYSWAGDTQLEDLEDYQARRLRRCTKCGAVEPLEASPAESPAINGLLPGMSCEGAFKSFSMDSASFGEESEVEVLMEKPGIRRGKNKSCPYCGASSWRDSVEEFEEIYRPIIRSDGSVIPGMVRVVSTGSTVDELGLLVPEMREEPTRVPFYKPNIYPVILQKNVSMYGKFLGGSDIDKIADQQNTINRIEAKVIDKLIKSGSYLSLPNEASIKADSEDMKIIRPGNQASKAMIDVYDLEGNIAQDLSYLDHVYVESRQAIGITDSFQGRADRTATSGKAKEFAAAQSAGRLESKRVMKDAAYAALFEAMFKFKLAYADEPRPVVSNDIHGNPKYSDFNRYDFLEKDAAGEWYWNDQFLFSCDNTAPLASNREAMWQETRMNLQTGAFGDPTNISTLILFWSKMEMLHYPGAGETKAYLEEELNKQLAESISAQMASVPGAGAAPVAAKGMEAMALKEPANNSLERRL